MFGRISRLCRIFKLAVPIEADYIHNIHDPSFREAVGERELIVYHGTSSKKLSKILEHGALDASIGKDYKTYPEASHGIFVTTKYAGFLSAELYARTSADSDGSDPVILELVLPLKWIGIDPDDMRELEGGEINQAGRVQGMVSKPISLNRIKKVMLQGDAIGKIAPAGLPGIFDANKTEWMTLSQAMKLIKKNKEDLPEEYEEMAGLGRRLNRMEIKKDVEDIYAEKFAILNNTFFETSYDVRERALVWLLKNPGALVGRVLIGLKGFYGDKFDALMEDLQGDYEPKPFESLARFLDRIAR